MWAQSELTQRVEKGVDAQRELTQRVEKGVDAQPELTQRVEKGDVVVQLGVAAPVQAVHLLQLPLGVGEPRLLQLEQLPQLVLGEVPDTPAVKNLIR